MLASRIVRLVILPTLMLEIFAGAVIALGADVLNCDHNGFGRRFWRGPVLGGLVFLLGLVLVIVGGAELFYWQSPNSHNMAR